MGEKNLEFSHNNTDEIINSLKACPIFADLPAALLEKIAPIVSWHYFSIGETVLTQSQINTRLFILLRGELEVIVDDEQVSVLMRSGDLIGEMSVISSNVVSATIRALTPCDMFSIEARDFSNLSSLDAQAFQHTLYRIFALILTEKLTETNNKARDFEIANRQLLDAQASLEEANRNLEAKVSQRTADLKKRTDDLVQSHLALEIRSAALRINQDKLEENNAFRNAAIDRIETFIAVELEAFATALPEFDTTSDEPFSKAKEKLKLDIENLRIFFQPLTAAFNSDMYMARQKVLLLESRIKEQIVAKMALGATGVMLDIATNRAIAEDLIEKNCYDIVFVSNDFVELTTILLHKNPNTKVVFMTSEDIADYLIILETYPSISNVVYLNDEDRSLTIKNITTTVSKLASQDLFGIEKYLSWGAEVLERKITGSDQRKEITGHLQKYLNDIGIRKNVISKIGAVAEELLMNAIYDAPIDSDGKSIYNHLPRTVRINLKQTECGLFRFACDGLNVAISVTDPFGGLTRKTIVNYLRNCYGKAPGTLNSEMNHKGGAGLGLYQLMATADLVVFNVTTGKRTEVIALFSSDPKAMKVRKKPSFHFFYR